MPSRTGAGVMVVMAAKVTRSRLDAGKRAANRQGAALTAELPSVGRRRVSCAGATPHSTERGAVPLPVRVAGGDAGPLAGAPRRRPRPRRVDGDRGPAAVALRPDGR